jgi:elongation factor P hydroxylase
VTDALLAILTDQAAFPPLTARQLRQVLHFGGWYCPEPSDEEVTAALEELMRAGTVEKIHGRGHAAYRRIQ